MKCLSTERKEHAALGRLHFSVTATVTCEHGSSREASEVLSVNIDLSPGRPARTHALASSVLVASDRNLFKGEKIGRQENIPHIQLWAGGAAD